MISPAPGAAGADAWPVYLGSLVGLCLAAEAFFSGAEVALVSVDRGRMRRLAETGSSAARLIQAMMERPERVLATTLIGTNLSVVAASFLANELIARRFGTEASAWSILILIPPILLFGEILPKTLARRHAEVIALRTAMPLRAAMALLAPLVAVTSGAARLLLRPFHRGAARLPFVTKEELRMILQADQRLELKREEAALIKRLVDFADARARDSMTPLVEVVSLPQEAGLQDAVRLVHERGYSRLPIYSGRKDNIIGLVEAMDLIDAPVDQPEQGVVAYIKKPFYVPETARIDRIMDDLRRNQQEMAVVVDEYGSAVGVLTLEDILEEIIGDILDEFDRPGRSGIEAVGERAVVAEGRVRLEDVEATLDVALPRAGFETLAGLATHLFQKVPQAGETIDHSGLRYTVIDATQRAVRKVRVEVLEPKSGDG